MKTIKPGLYRHYKGQEYVIEKTVRHSETDEPMVVYQARYGDFDWWVRPLDMFFDIVTLEDRKVQRFEWISDIV